MAAVGIVLQLPREGVGNLDGEIEVREGRKIPLGMNKPQNIRMVNRHHCHVGTAAKGPLLYGICCFREDS